LSTHIDTLWMHHEGKGSWKERTQMSMAGIKHNFRTGFLIFVSIEHIDTLWTLIAHINWRSNKVSKWCIMKAKEHGKNEHKGAWEAWHQALPIMDASR